MIAPITYPVEVLTSTDFDVANKIVAFISNGFNLVQKCNRIDKDFIRISFIV